MGFKSGTSTGVVKIAEQADAESDTGGVGQIWVKSNAPCDLFFTDDTGQDVRITNDGSLAAAPGSSVAADDINAGDAAVLLTTDTGNITIDAAANNTDIIFKGTDGGADTTFLTLDGSEKGAAAFNDAISGAAALSAHSLAIQDGSLKQHNDRWCINGHKLHFRGSRNSRTQPSNSSRCCHYRLINPSWCFVN